MFCYSVRDISAGWTRTVAVFEHHTLAHNLRNVRHENHSPVFHSVSLFDHHNLINTSRV